MSITNNCKIAHEISSYVANRIDFGREISVWDIEQILDKNIPVEQQVRQVAPQTVLLAEIVDVLDTILGDTDPQITNDWTDEEIKDEYPIYWVFTKLVELQKLSKQSA